MKTIKNNQLEQGFVPNTATRYKNMGLTKPNDRKLPELYDKRENCCGCTACYAVCPKEAIKMEPDEEGFLYPVVDASKCIRCYECTKVCIFKEAKKDRGYL